MHRSVDGHARTNRDVCRLPNGSKDVVKLARTWLWVSYVVE